MTTLELTSVELQDLKRPEDREDAKLDAGIRDGPFTFKAPPVDDRLSAKDLQLQRANLVVGMAPRRSVQHAWDIRLTPRGALSVPEVYPDGSV